MFLSGVVTRQPVEIYGRNAGYGFAGLGVSTAIGNYTETDVDLSFPDGLLGLLDWLRTYNSRSGAVGALGPGWATSFSAHLVAGGGGDPVTFYDEDGRILTFTATHDGYSRPQDLAADLTRNTGGSFTLAYNSGLVWSFDPAGRLTGRELEGQRVTVDYDADDLLLRVGHTPSGRHLVFSYDANRRLTSVAASDGRAVSFSYGAGDAASSLLESVTDPGGGMSRFEWAGSGEAAQIARITNPDNNLVVANTYDPTTRRVSSQQFAGGGSADFGYDDATATTTVTAGPSGARAMFQANADGRLEKMTDAAGNAATFSYDARGHLAEAVTPGGTHLAQTHDPRGNLLATTWGGATTNWTYDDANRVTSVTNAVGGTTRYVYTGTSHIPAETTSPGGGVSRTPAANGLITSSTDADGYTTTYFYDTNTNLVSATSPLNEITRYSYDAAGNRTELTMPSGAASQWAYDSAGRVTQFTGPDDAVTRWRYSSAGLLLERTEPDGTSVRYDYDTAGNQTSITGQVGNETILAYDAEGNLTSRRNPDGGLIAYTYTAVGQIASLTDEVGGITRYTWSADGANTVQEGPAGTTRIEYDARGNAVAVTDPATATVRYSYDAADRMTSLTSADGGTWQLGYDADGNVVSAADASGARGTPTWSKAGRLLTVTDSLGRQTSAARDAAGRITETTDPEGGLTRYVYDPDGRLISVTTPAGLQTRYAYNTAGRRVKTTDPRGWVTREEYNSRGERTAVIAPGGAITRYGYDAGGHLTEMTDPNGSVTRYGYDNAGHVISVTDAKDAVTRYAYDNAGRLTAVTDPLNRTTRREYGKAGTLTAIIDPAGVAQHMTYDAGQRVTRWTADDGSEVSYTYDKAGHRTSMTDATGTTHFGYDQAGRLVSITGPDGEQAKAAYDMGGQLTSMIYPGGLTVDYSYDLNGRLTGLHDSRAGDAVYALDPDGRLLTEQLPEGLARRYHYENGLLSQFLVIRDGHLVAETVLTHDPDGRILTQRDQDAVRVFGYDRAGQLVRAELRYGYRSDELHLVYDAVGNRVSLRHGEAEVRYRYDAADQLLSLETRGRRAEFRYDPTGRLTEEREGEQRRTIQYNGFGWPVETTRVRGDERDVIQATHDGNGLVAELALARRWGQEEEEEEKAASVRYRWNANEAVPQILTQRAEPELDDAERDHPGRLNADFAYGYGRTFTSWEHGAATFHHDVYGSELRTEDTDAWTQARNYEIFGAPAEPWRASEPPDHERRERGEYRDRDGEQRPRPPELPRFGYRGELALGGMIDLRARSYDAELGRFTTRDPLLNGAPSPGEATNPYVYANNDPVNFTDPLGTFAIIPGAAMQIASQVRQAPTSPRQASSAATLTSSVEMLVAGVGGDKTTLHTAATRTGAAQLAAQYVIHYPGGLPGIRFEVPVPGAKKPKKQGIPPFSGPEGKIDIFFEYAGPPQSVYIWEVRSAITPGSELARAAAAANEAAWYARVYAAYQASVNPPGPAPVIAAPGDPLLAPAYAVVPGFSTIKVYSLPVYDGAVLYNLAPRQIPPPFPVYDYDRQAKRVDLRLPQYSPIQIAAIKEALGAAGVVVAAVAVGAAAAAGIDALFALLARLALLFGS